MISNLEFTTALKNGNIPADAPEDSAYHFELRDFAIQKHMWAMITQNWVKELADWVGNRKVLEVMAGAGWLAKALHDEGIDIIATDKKDYKKVFKIQLMDGLKAIEDFKNQRDLLLISWPPYAEFDVCEICENWSKTIIYIGEGRGGCNAPDLFFDNFNEEFYMEISQWWGLHDYLMAGYYRKEVKDS